MSGGEAEDVRGVSVATSTMSGRAIGHEPVRSSGSAGDGARRS
jgi:hypothetical protein